MKPEDGRLTPVTAEEVREALAHTEVIETPTVDFVLSPGQVWAVQKTKWADTHQIEVPEETFWELVAFCLGEAALVEMKQDLEDLLVWEGEGGSCTPG